MHPFEVMAEPIRRRIVEILAVGEHPSSIIVDVIRFEFSVTSAAVSHHLRVLRGKLPDGFTRATHRRRDALRDGA
ncbi:hypothetical protein ACLQ2Q_08695 [Microbacterium sp. DT81.1]|uniref:hypothetical protein n=1 Tax=Microbacterium sp. DT81.1 TaxID=3393413 RepID=UPI003CE8C7F4